MPRQFPEAILRETTNRSHWIGFKQSVLLDRRSTAPIVLDHPGVEQRVVPLEKEQAVLRAKDSFRSQVADETRKQTGTQSSFGHKVALTPVAVRVTEDRPSQTRALGREHIGSAGGGTDPAPR
jgi:hypothetical protein